MSSMTIKYWMDSYYSLEFCICAKLKCAINMLLQTSKLLTRSLNMLLK